MRVSERDTTVIIADPPWPHANGSRTNSGKSPKYPLMTIDELCALGETVRDLSGDNAVLYLWIGTPHLPGALRVVESWGFKYKSVQVWRKRRPACGFWVRSDAELVLVCERGAACEPREVPRTVFEASPLEGRHSSKPMSLHEQVERMWPTSTKRELFARTRRDGWDCVGSDLGKLITPQGLVAC